MLQTFEKLYVCTHPAETLKSYPQTVIGDTMINIKATDLKAAIQLRAAKAPLKKGTKLYMMGTAFWDYVFDNSSEDDMEIVGSIDSDLSAGVEIMIDESNYEKFGLGAKPNKANVKKAIAKVTRGVGKITAIELEEGMVLATMEFTSKDVQKLASDSSITIGKNKKGDPVVE